MLPWVLSGWLFSRQYEPGCLILRFCYCRLWGLLSCHGLLKPYCILCHRQPKVCWILLSRPFVRCVVTYWRNRLTCLCVSVTPAVWNCAGRLVIAVCVVRPVLVRFLTRSVVACIVGPERSGFVRPFVWGCTVATFATPCWRPNGHFLRCRYSLWRDCWHCTPASSWGRSVWTASFRFLSTGGKDCGGISIRRG